MSAIECEGFRYSVCVHSNRLPKRNKFYIIYMWLFRLGRRTNRTHTSTQGRRRNRSTMIAVDSNQINCRRHNSRSHSFRMQATLCAQQIILYTKNDCRKQNKNITASTYTVRMQFTMPPSIFVWSLSSLSTPSPSSMNVAVMFSLPPAAVRLNSYRPMKLCDPVAKRIIQDAHNAPEASRPTC